MLLKAREKQHAAEIAKLRRSHAAAVDRLALENSQLCARVQRGVDEVRIRNGFDTKERLLLKRIRELEEEVSERFGICFSGIDLARFRNRAWTLSLRKRGRWWRTIGLQTRSRRGS